MMRLTTQHSAYSSPADKPEDGPQSTRLATIVKQGFPCLTWLYARTVWHGLRAVMKDLGVSNDPDFINEDNVDNDANYESTNGVP